MGRSSLRAPLEQTFWKLWYRYLSRRIGREPVTFINFGFWPPDGEMLALEPRDEADRPAIQLYHLVASGTDLADKAVLEVSCGHGGGASFVTRYHRPRSYTAIDQNPDGIKTCRMTHGGLGIDFQIGDAQALAFPDRSFDAVLNVEASHCYPRQGDFFRSTYRVLRPGGFLLYADFRRPNEDATLDRHMATAGFEVVSKVDITPDVLRALRRTSDQFRALIRRLGPRILHRPLESFAAVEGSRMYENFQQGRRIYWSYRLMKPSH